MPKTAVRAGRVASASSAARPCGGGCLGLGAAARSMPATAAQGHRRAHVPQRGHGCIGVCRVGGHGPASGASAGVAADAGTPHSRGAGTRGRCAVAGEPQSTCTTAASGTTGTTGATGEVSPAAGHLGQNGNRLWLVLLQTGRPTLRALPLGVRSGCAPVAGASKKGSPVWASPVIPDGASVASQAASWRRPVP